MAKTVSVGSDAANIDLLWNPYQQAFLQALRARTPRGYRAFDRLSLFAGRRGGKTKIGAVAAVNEMQPGTLGWACAPSYPELEDYVIPAIMELLPRSWIADWSQSRRELTLVNKARVGFRSLDDPNRGRGPGLDWCWIDEARKVQQLAWDVISPAIVGNGGVAWFTTTPNSFDWCYERLWKPADDGEPGYWATKYWTVENPVFRDPLKRAALERDRRQMDPVFFAQEYQADFVTFTGAIYGAALNQQIVGNDDVPMLKKLFPEWPRIDPSRVAYVGIDPGADHPFASVLLVSSELGLVQVGEYIAQNRSAVEHKRGIFQMLARWNPDRPFTPDRWAIDRSQRQMAIELAQAPFPINCTAAENDVRAGINRVRAWVETRQLWILGDECKRTVEQLRGYRWDENINTDGTYKREQPMKRSDDLPDALRYCLMLYPEVPEPIANALTRPGIELFSGEQLWALDRMDRINKRERGEIEPDEEIGGGAGLFEETVSRRYFDDEEQADSGPGGVGDLWS